MVAIHQMPVAVVHRPHESLCAHHVQSDDQSPGVFRGFRVKWDDLWFCSLEHQLNTKETTSCEVVLVDIGNLARNLIPLPVLRSNTRDGSIGLLVVQSFHPIRD